MNSDDGNTSDRRLRSWFFTYNNPEISATQLSQLLDGPGEINKYAFQLERGEGGTPHYQGVINYRNQIQFSSLRALDPNIHWEPCRSLRQALQYCTKSDTREDGPWVLGWEYKPRSWTIQNPYLWQQQVLERIHQGQGDRRIMWVADTAGGWGKTTLAKHLCGDLGGVLVTGRAADIKYAVAIHLRRRGSLRLCVFHFTRTQEEFVSYQAIEEVKDGLFFTSKYESGMCIFDSPFILVLANFHPDRSKLTGDRWDVNIIGADQGLWPSL